MFIDSKLSVDVVYEGEGDAVFLFITLPSPYFLILTPMSPGTLQQAHSGCGGSWLTTDLLILTLTVTVTE